MESTNIITEELIYKALQNMGFYHEEEKPSVDFINDQDVTELKLDYLSINKIENLWYFTNLKKLKLDNNLIETIEGLDGLKHLCILDLSFNMIKKIEGLDMLSNLEELSLYNNQIRKLENLEKLINLQLFSVGNNLLTTLDEILILQCLPKLKSLNMAGNPFCEIEHYKETVVTHLNELLFLDYSKINENEKRISYGGIKNDMHEDKENIKSEKSCLEMKDEIYEDSILVNMDGSKVLKMMYLDDDSGLLLRQLSCVSVHFDKFQNNIIKLFEEMRKQSLEKYKERCTEINEFNAYLQEAKQKNLQSVISEIDNFTVYKTKIWKELSSTVDKVSAENIMTSYYDKIAELWERLMYLEVQMVDQLDESMKLFEQNMKDLLNGWMDKIRLQLSECRKVVHHYNLMTTQEVMALCDHLMTNQWQEEVLQNDKLRNILMKKDTLPEALRNSLEAHMQVLDSLDDSINREMKVNLEHYMEELHQNEEIGRNRNRIIEINHFIDFLRDEIDNNAPSPVVN